MDRSRLNRMNERLRVELGSQPLYSWVYSNDLTLPMARMREPGVPVLDYKFVGSVLVPVYVYDQIWVLEGRVDSQGRSYANRWILCWLQVLSVSPEQWRDMYRGLVDFPPGGKKWVPVGWGSQLMALPEGQDVLEETNEYVINRIKRMRDVTVRELKELEEIAEERKRRESRKICAGKIGEALVPDRVTLTADGEVDFHFPGKRDWVSYASAEREGKET